LGLNGCLADDMGLGKSVQVIARLVQERELLPVEGEIEKREDGRNKEVKGDGENVNCSQTSVLPTLLIALTSVVGNWQREIAKFAPHLQSIVHHGSERLQNLPDFKTTCQQHDVIITSFTLARKDEKLL
jgi:SNF2 family DNA or RNA helicase